MTFFADEIDAIEFDSGATLNTARTSNPGGSNTQILPRPTQTSATRETPNNSNNNSNNSNDTRITGSNPNSSQTNTQTSSPNGNSINNSAQTNRPSAVNTTPAQTNASNTQTANPSSTTPTTNSSTRTVQPIRLNIKVLADNTANGWTNAGWVVKKGQRIRITGAGRISLGGGLYSNPGGLSTLTDKDKLIQSQATGGLIAVIGDDNNDFIFVGNSKEFTATRDGALFLGINEGNLNDNSGSFDVTIEVELGN
jgi:hypothetical protein